MQRHEAWADVIVVQGMGFRIFSSIARTDKVVVADLYDPFQLEQLEMNKYSEPAQWEDEVTKAVSLLNEQIARADCFLCASEQQRNLWLGNLSALGRLNPATYTADPTFESLIRVVPFGLPPVAPVQRRHAIKGAVPGIEADDKVLIWGGGIYNWFDPATLVEAMGLLAETHPDIKLFFLSARHFNPDIPDMKALADAVEAAESSLRIQGGLSARCRPRSQYSPVARGDAILVPHAHPRLSLGRPPNSNHRRRRVR
jgi:hypothetical protein